MEIKFRKLKASEIDVRVGTCSQKGVSLLLYKDARVDMNILDETVGSMNWQKDYKLIDGQLFCTVSIYDEDKKEWISKTDVGVESNTEAEKGRASDAQKRACVCVGIGRELYSAPFIWIPANKCSVEQSNGKWKCNDKFKVSHIAYSDEGDVNELQIVNAKTGNEVYRYKTVSEKETELASEADKKLINDLCKLLEYDKSILLQECGWQTGDEFTTEIATRCKAKLNEISEQRKNGK